MVKQWPAEKIEIRWLACGVKAAPRNFRSKASLGILIPSYDHNANFNRPGTEVGIRDGEALDEERNSSKGGVFEAELGKETWSMPR